VLLAVTGEMGLRREVEVLGEAGRLDDLPERGLAPLAAHARTAERLRQPARLADKLLLLVDDTADETSQLAAVPRWSTRICWTARSSSVSWGSDAAGWRQRARRMRTVAQAAPAMKAITRVIEDRSR
jgi:hypothetical protein